MSTEKVHFQMEMFGIADRSVNGRIEGQKVQNSSLAGCGKKSASSGKSVGGLARTSRLCMIRSLC